MNYLSEYFKSPFHYLYTRISKGSNIGFMLKLNRVHHIAAICLDYEQVEGFLYTCPGTYSYP